ncbi:MULTISPECIES: hypothetical protein [unclassified Streptomyces]|uniref:hypothetical protein n=1 Tax=unclassified Streptomyces TaxID=2593676 RepID=UPI002E0E8238|nr:hypothetical protein OG772_19980 [Streptomyces sp. NBC_01321]WSP60047.1 hypothetical protein OG306_15735 [Streptomyces sp. NBC_01241]
MYGLRVALWAIGLVALGCSFFLMRSDLPEAVLMLSAVLSLACPLVAEGQVAHRKQKVRQAEQRGWYAQNVGSIDALRQAVDEQGLRRIRDEKGSANAVREVKRRLPRGGGTLRAGREWL